MLPHLNGCYGYMYKVLCNYSNVNLFRLSRNHYAKQLLLTLQSGVLCAPFNTEPPIRLSQVNYQSIYLRLCVHT